MLKDECKELADRFAKMAANGLVDVKFFMRDLEDAVVRQVCAEVNAMYDAVDRGECTPLKFNDSYETESKLLKA